MVTLDIVGGITAGQVEMSSMNYDPNPPGSVSSYTTGGLTVTLSGGSSALSLSITPSGGTVTVTGRIIYNISVSPGGNGIYAIAPTVSAGLSVSSLVTQTLTGNATSSTSLVITNDSSSAVSLSALNFVADPSVSTQLTFTSNFSPITLNPGQAHTFTLTWQNNNVNGGGGTYNNTINLVTTAGTIPIANPVQANFGISVIPDVSGTINVTSSYSLYYTVTGYGGVLNMATIQQVGSTTGGTGVSLVITTVGGIIDYVYLNLDTTQIYNQNGLTCGFTLSAQDSTLTYTSQVSLTATFNINVADQHLGSWLSSQYNNNAIIGFSYDIINGKRQLTMGFGQGGGDTTGELSSGSYPYYSGSTDAANSADPTRHLSVPILQPNGSGVYYRYTNNSYSRFLNTYGAWINPQGSGGSWDTTGAPFTFLVRDTGTYSYEFQIDNIGDVFIDYGTSNEQHFIVNGSYGTGQSTAGTTTLTAGIHTISWSAINTGGPGNVGVRITNSANYDIFSTLQISSPSWYETGRLNVSYWQYINQPFPLALINSTEIYSDGNTYASYFQNGAVVNVYTDGSYNLDVTLNGIRQLSGNTDTDSTLSNSQYLFYYYTYSGDVISYIGSSGSTTPYFTGFDASGNVTTVTQNTP